MYELIAVVFLPWLSMGYLLLSVYILIRHRGRLRHFKESLVISKERDWHLGIRACNDLISLYSQKVKSKMDSVFLSIILLLVTLLNMVIALECY